MASEESSEISPADEVYLEARRRILYKYAKPHMSDEPAGKKELQRKVIDIITEELPVEEHDKLKEDLEREREMIEEMVSNTIRERD